MVQVSEQAARLGAVVSELMTWSKSKRVRELFTDWCGMWVGQLTRTPALFRIVFWLLALYRTLVC